MVLPVFRRLFRLQDWLWLAHTVATETAATLGDREWSRGDVFQRRALRSTGESPGYNPITDMAFIAGLDGFYVLLQ